MAVTELTEPEQAGAEQWLSYLLIAAGWVLISTVAAGAARVLTRR